MTALRKNRSSAKQAGSCLVVEDSMFDQERLRRILSHSFKDLQTTFTPTLEGAREAVEGSTPDVILLDNNLPDGQGANFALELSEDPRFAHIPVVMVSDWPTPFMYHKAEMAGVRHLVSKADFGARYIHSALSA